MTSKRNPKTPNARAERRHSDQSDFYQIRMEGHLDPQWAAWFGDLTLTLEANGDTLLTGPIVDQAALFGLLRKVQDLGLPLVSVVRLDNTAS